VGEDKQCFKKSVKGLLLVVVVALDNHYLLLPMNSVIDKGISKMTDEIKIRMATLDDAIGMVDIYNFYIENGTATFEEDVLSVEVYKERLLELIEGNLPIFAAIGTDSDLLGFAYASYYNPRSAYRFTVENSVYVNPKHKKKGIGKKLLAELMLSCRNNGFKRMIAVIGDSKNVGSIELHKSLGFNQIGIARKVGYKFETWLDVVYMQFDL
jgi:phosphinothricin acetyltransferase